MAVYSKLLLSAGGGIVSSMQQAEQARNTATLLIGLGGTGIDCLRTIKTQVRSRLRPDDPEAVVAKYEHIRFLGVDTAEKSKGNQDEDLDGLKAGSVMALDDTECFSIANAQVKKAFTNPKSLSMRDDLSWLCWEDIKAPDLSTAGAGGIRQVGRYMMMDKSKSFMNRVEQEINAAKAGLNSPTVNVHIFSGLSGGTGSGCFLDVCYMVRHIANKVGGVTIFGYFFLPDVNLSRIPFSDNKTRAFIPKNGYAAMQELDYCMQLQYNGGSFTQMYQDHTEIVWRDPPVDMCHLVCATNAKGDIIENAYDYSMNVTAEYIMDFLTHSDDKFGLDQQLSNFVQKILQGDGEKIIGANLAYCVIGASCACLPLREINTYLASELFGKFAQIGHNIPTKADVEWLATSALARNAQGLTDVYNTLYQELCTGFDSSYVPYADDWKYVRDYGNSEMVTSYTNQTASKLNTAIKNSRSMTSINNERSLINRVRAQLTEVCRDIERGPIFACGLISAAQSHNLLNIIDGLIQENISRWDQESAKSVLRQSDYETARANFDNRRKRSLFDSNQNRFNDCEYYLMLLEQHKLALSCYKELDGVLKTFRKQVEDIASDYYGKFSQTVETLIQTFKENRDALAGGASFWGDSSFAVPMVTVNELKDSLDAEVEKINMKGIFYIFVNLLLEHEDAWIAGDENKIAKLVNSFFVDTAFYGFANRTITSFLKDKYSTDNDEQLVNKVYSDYIKPLLTKAGSHFPFSTVWTQSDTARSVFLSLPESSWIIQAAAEHINNWNREASTLPDRIFAMHSHRGFPLCAYGLCAEYADSYFKHSITGRHSYEGKPVPDMPFTDWRKLPLLTPQSILPLEKMPEHVQMLVRTAQELYDQAAGAGIFDDTNHICVPDPVRTEEIRVLAQEAEEMTAHTAVPSDSAALREMLDRLHAARDIPMSPTEYWLRNDGCNAKREIKLSIQKDYFVSSPAYHDLVRDILHQIDDLKAAIDHAANAIQHKMEDVN